MRVLVTGGAGFIGSHVVEQLFERGHQLSVVDDLSMGDRKNLPAGVPLFEIDICDGAAVESVFESVQPQLVSHHAAQMSVSFSMRDPAFDARVNVTGLLNVLQSSARVGAKRVVFASSGGVLYGDSSLPAEEVSPVHPISPYGISKWVGERYVEFFATDRNLQGIALRYANVYGPRQSPHGEAGVVAIFSQKMLAGHQATINGDGQYVRDYVHVSDVARANVLSLESEISHPFIAMNIGTGKGTDVNELAAKVYMEVDGHCKKAGVENKVHKCRHGEARRGDLRSNLLCSDLALQLLGWGPTIELSDGLRDTVAWFARQKELTGNHTKEAE